MNKEEVNRIIGNKIKIAREARGMTLEELALKTGYSSRSAIGHIERGARSLSMNRAQLIAMVLRVDPKWLINLEDTPPIFVDQSPIELLVEQLTPENQTNLIKYAEFLIKQQEEQGNE